MVSILIMSAVVRVVLLLAVLAGCGPRPPSGGAPPRGKTEAEYLATGKPTPGQRPPGLDDRQSMVVHVIDIGQGLAVLVELPCGAALIDTGGEQDEGWDGVAALTGYLDRFFARRTDLSKTLSLLAITHPHIDHTRGIEAVLARYQVLAVIDNGMERDDIGGKPQTALHAWAREHGVDYRAVLADELGPTGATDGTIDPIHGCQGAAEDPKIRALWGQLVGGREQFSDNPNDHSLVLRIDYGVTSVLIPGDLEAPGSSRLDDHYAAHPELLDVDLWIVGHHGSKNATHEYILKKMSPELAVISAGPYERDQPWTARAFGHPNKLAIDKLCDPGFGVRRSRKPIEPWIGVKGAWPPNPSVFARQAVDRAVYCTCWDGSVRVRMFPGGWIEVDADR